MTAKKFTAFPQTIDKEYYAAIGEICARWSWLEFQCGVIARETIKITKPAGFAITGGMSMRSISTVLIALSLGNLPKGKPKIIKAIYELGDKLSKIDSMRNEYAHALWSYECESNPDLGIRKLKTAKDRIELKWINKPLKRIHSDAKLLAGLQVRAQEITDALKGRPTELS